MATVKRFEDLKCWQEARDFVNLIYQFTKKKEFSKDFDLKSQIRRSAISCMANIAEGFHRNSNKEFLRFLDYSRASIAETISHCHIAFQQNYIETSELEQAKELSDRIWKKVNKMVSYLNERN